MMRSRPVAPHLSMDRSGSAAGLQTIVARFGRGRFNLMTVFPLLSNVIIARMRRIFEVRGDFCSKGP